METTETPVDTNTSILTRTVAGVKAYKRPILVAAVVIAAVVGYKMVVENVDLDPTLDPTD